MTGRLARFGMESTLVSQHVHDHIQLGNERAFSLRCARHSSFASRAFARGPPSAQLNQPDYETWTTNQKYWWLEGVYLNWPNRGVF